MTLKFNELEEEQVRVEQRIAELLLADGFVEDLAYLESYRKTLVAAISVCQKERRKPIGELDVWRRVSSERGLRTSHAFGRAVMATMRITTMSYDNGRIIVEYARQEDKATAPSGHVSKAWRQAR